MKVKAIAVGFHGGRRIRVGTVLDYRLAKGELLPSWLAPVEPVQAAPKPEVSKQPPAPQAEAKEADGDGGLV